MFDAVPHSFFSIETISLICLPGGMYSEMSSVPRPCLDARLSSIFFRRYLSRDVLFPSMNDAPR